MADAREIARRVLRRVEQQGAYGSVALAAELARAELSAADRGLATELVYGVLRHRTRLDRALAAKAVKGKLKANLALRIALRVGAYQLLLLDRIPAHAAVDDAVRAARALGGPRVAGFANKLLRRLADEGEPPLPPRTKPRAYAELVGSLPPWLVDALAEAVGAEQLAAAADGLAQAAPLAIRVNRTRATRDEVVARLTREGARAEPVAALPDALHVTGLGDPAASPSFRAGLWTVQDTSAQRVALLLEPAAGERILDGCAGVGGKATHIAELTAGGARITAADASPAKLTRLADTAARLGLRGIQAEPRDLTEPLDDTYDAVLLDAPCTGLGVLRRHPEAKWRVTEADVAAMAALQSRMLDAVAAAVAPGGRLVYSVCTFTAAEGAAQIDAFLARQPAFREVTRLSTWPHVDGGDAFFAAKLVRAAC